MIIEKRPYRMKARAERQNETRQRIVEATVGLHREVGPARTTIADVARRAGVERLTVYNHFARIEDLLAACQVDFLSDRPPPQIMPSRGGGRPLDGFEDALVRLYSWYRANEQMERNVHRDRLLVPELAALLRRNADPHYEAAAAGWAKAIAGRGRTDSVKALIRVALDFSTWDMLARRRLSNRRIAELWRTAVRAASSGSARSSR